MSKLSAQRRDPTHTRCKKAGHARLGGLVGMVMLPIFLSSVFLLLFLLLFFLFFLLFILILILRV
jgi:hypothetical protein